MEDTQLYAMLLGIKHPWRVSKVQVDMASQRVDVWVEEGQGTKFLCAVCKQEAGVYDHTEEQVWRHLVIYPSTIKTSSIQPRHSSLCPGFINKNKSGHLCDHSFKPPCLSG